MSPRLTCTPAKCLVSLVWVTSGKKLTLIGVSTTISFFQRAGRRILFLLQLKRAGRGPHPVPAGRPRLREGVGPVGPPDLLDLLGGLKGSFVEAHSDRGHVDVGKHKVLKLTLCTAGF
jgi:hypothetical protein